MRSRARSSKVNVEGGPVLREQTPAGQPSARRRPRALVVAFALAVLAAPLAATAAIGAGHSAPPLVRAEGHSRATPGSASRLEKPQAGVAKRAHLSKPARLGKPKVLYLKKARSVVFDVRKLRSVVVKRERAEDGGPARDADADAANTDADAANTDADAADTDADAANTDAAKRGAAPATAETSTQSPAAPAPAPDSCFDGLDFANWGAGHPPDTNGDVGPTYYIQTINTLDRDLRQVDRHARVAAFTFNAFMSQGQFREPLRHRQLRRPGRPLRQLREPLVHHRLRVQDRRRGNVNPPAPSSASPCRRPATRSPAAGTSIRSPLRAALNDYPKFGVWPDGIYMSANMFGYAAARLVSGLTARVGAEQAADVRRRADGAGRRLLRRHLATSRSSRRTHGCRRVRRRRDRPSTSSRRSSS